MADGSIQDYINAQVKKRQTQEIQKIPVPRIPRLVIKYQAMDSRTLIRMGLETQEAVDPVQGLIDASIDALIAASVGSESDRGEDLGLPLGAALASFLGFEGAINPDPHKADREGVYLLFEDEAEIVETANQLSQFQQRANQKIAEDLVKNSEEAAQV